MEGGQEDPLSHAIARGDISFVRGYIFGGGNVNAVKFQASGRTPLMEAASNNQTAIVAILLENGATVSKHDFVGDTALHRACQDGSVDTARLLLEAGADPSAPGMIGWTPLHACIFCLGKDESGPRVEAQKATIRLLLERGADINAFTGDGRAPAYEISNVQLAAFLADECGVDFRTLKDHKGRTPLFESRSELTAFLIGKGVDVNARSKNGSSALHENGNATQELLEGGAAIDAVNNNGWRPIHCACACHVSDSIIDMLHWGADLSGPAPEGFRRPSLEEGLVDRLAPFLGEILAGHRPFPPTTAWLKWLLASPIAASRIAALVAEATSQCASESSAGLPPAPRRKELLKPLEDRAWDARKHLVCCYFKTRRLRREGGDPKRSKPPPSHGAGAGAAAEEEKVE